MFFSSGSFTNLNRLKMSEKVCRQMEVITFVPTANCAIIQSFPKIVLRIDEARSLSAPVHGCMRSVTVDGKSICRKSTFPAVTLRPLFHNPSSSPSSIYLVFHGENVINWIRRQVIKFVIARRNFRASRCRRCATRGDAMATRCARS